MGTLRPTSEDSSFFGGYHLWILVWFSSVWGVYIVLNEPRLNVVAKRKINGITCIFCIIRIFNTPKCRKCRKCSGIGIYFINYPLCTPCTLAHFQNAKVSIMPGGIFRNSSKRKNQTVQECKECMGQ